jgi:hypothetical protein
MPQFTGRINLFADGYWSLLGAWALVVLPTLAVVLEFFSELQQC